MMKCPIPLLTLLSISFALQSRVIIFDLGDTLVRPISTRMIRSVGIWHFISYLGIDWHNPFTMKEHIDTMIQKILSLYRSPFDAQCNEIPRRADGLPISPLMIDWHAGRISSEDARIIAKTLLLIADLRAMFISPRERNLIAATIDAIFTPKILANTLMPIPEAIALLEAIGTLQDATTGEPHRCMILSNFDSETIRFFAESKQGKELFSYFNPEDIALSADFGELKPRPAIYEEFMKHYRLDPANCIFIDDRPENIIAAEDRGIQGVVITPDGYLHALATVEAYSL